MAFSIPNAENRETMAGSISNGSLFEQRTAGFVSGLRFGGRNGERYSVCLTQSAGGAPQKAIK